MPVIDTTVKDGSVFVCDHRDADTKLRHAFMAIPGPEGNTALADARQRAWQIQTDAEAAQAESEAGQKLATLRKRYATAAAALDKATAEHQAAETAHFDSLSNGSETEVDASREEVVKLYASLEMRKREADVLNRLVSSASSEFTKQTNSYLEAARLEAQRQAQAEFDEAYKYILSTYHTPAFQDALKAMAISSMIGQVCHHNGRYFEDSLQTFVATGGIVQ